MHILCANAIHSSSIEKEVVCVEQILPSITWVNQYQICKLLKMEKPLDENEFFVNDKMYLCF